MYVLYGARGSGAAAVEAALVLAGIPYRMVDAASWQPGPGLDELTRVNPLAQIPTLVLPDGSVMTESAAILIHLGLAHPDSGLLPRGPIASDPRPRLRRGQLLRGDRHHRLSRSVIAAMPTMTMNGNASSRERASACITCGTYSPTRSPRIRI